jgi:penicillin amidase
MTEAVEAIALAGLGAAAEICVDIWGVPHIRAASLPDLFFAQGFNAARDRLWQIDLARKRGLGLLAGDFGPGFLAQDHAARRFVYRGDMAAEWAAYGPDARDICTSFAAGINAYIDLVAREPARLPPEFTALGTKPATWAPEDVVRVRTHAWVRNAASEILRANVMARADAETDLLRAHLDPPITPAVPAGIDPATIPLDLLDAYRLAFVPVGFSHDRLAASLDQAPAWSKVTPAGEVVADPGQGSNNWTIAGCRTATGRPVLANDPHRAHAAPSLRYLVHLTAPGFDAIGAGEATFPGIMIGHNGEIAFGLTLFMGHDEEDVYVYETRPGQPNDYRYQDAWEAMRVVEERVPVRGAADRTLTLKFTRHGPVVLEEPDKRRAYAVRTVLAEPGTAAYAASLIAMRCRDFAGFRAAMRHWGAPAVNQVYADRGGTIGWVVAGFNPVRETWDGLLPVPGDGRHEWRGFTDPDHLPWSRNPAAGFVATANEMNVPADWPHLARPIGYEWWETSRARRLHEVLAGQTRHAVADSQLLQTDVVSVPARRLQPLLAALADPDRDTWRALMLLRGWDCQATADSGPAALFEVWWSGHLKPALLALLAPDAARALLVPLDTESVVRALESPGPRFGPDPAAARDRLLAGSLAAAYRDVGTRLGADPAGWRWGALHHGYFAHALTPLAVAAGSRPFDVGPLPKAGSDATPMLAAYRPSDFRVVLGASVRIVIDVGEWDNSVWMNAPGQSGDPRSPHYADLAPLWAKGEYVPMLYGRAAVERAIARRIALRPSGA